MQCGICDRHSRRITCGACAQGNMWPLRSDFLFKTAERDAASEKVEEYLEGCGGVVEAAVARRGELQERADCIRRESERLRESIRADRARIEKLRNENAARRRRMDAIREAEQNRHGMMEVVKTDIKRINQKWKLVYARTVEARSFLCREAAALYGLRLKRRRSGKVEYSIGGVLLPNLMTDLNVHPHTNLNVSLDHLAHLLVLISHYLGLKLPNEIILSGRDNPFTSMRGLLNNRHMAARPLYAESPLAVMARENPTAHSKFVEGVSMLALDIAWLCYSQGLSINEVDDAANIGLCMWKLLVAKDSTAITNPSFGKASHATINGYLASSRHEVVMRDFKLRYNLIADRIRYTLQGETIVADWDMVPDAEKEPKATRRRSVAEMAEERFVETTSPSRPSSLNGGGVGRWTRIRARKDAS